jgi:CheY-like chemotaxis protein
MIQTLGYDAVAADGGREAIDYLRECTAATPELIILDCHMPCIDGLGVLRFVRGDPRLSAVPVVIFTSDVWPETRPDFDKLGVQGWIRKASMDWDEIAHVAERFATKKSN